MRAILDLPAGEDADAVVFCSNAEILRRHAGGPVDAEGYLHEAAGRRFFERFEAVEEDPKDDSNDDCDSSGDGENVSPGKKKKDNNLSSAGILKLSSVLEGVKLYPLMRIDDGASQDDIKKAYRALALESHPDKLTAASEAEAKQVQENFIKIQEAYEILSDPEKRRLYDSSLPFDDRLPKFSKEEGDDDFFAIFGEAFRRNARFATKKPVPDIGDENTDLKDVKRFYDYWFGFQSWRDPLAMAQAAEEELADLEDAECREEKRWMMRENARIGKKYKQAEQERVRRLVEKAESNDPRIIAEKQAKKAVREADLKAKQDERMAVQLAKEAEELRLREIEEAKSAAEAEKRRAERAIKDAEKGEVKKLRQRLRSFHPSVQETVELDQLNEICLQLERSTLEQLGNDVDAALKSKKKNIADRAASATKLIYAAIESLGMKPVVPQKEEDAESTEAERAPAPAKIEDPALLIQRLEAEEKRRKEREELEAIKEAERAQQAIKAAEERKKRDDQRKKDEVAAEAKRKQLEKKDREKSKKEEDKKAKAAQDEIAKRDKQREDAKLQKELQSQQDQEAAANAIREKEEAALVKLFDDDRLERLEYLDALSDAAIRSELATAFDSDASLRGALHLLKQASIDEEQRKDCLMVLIMRRSPAWQLGLAPPAEIKAIPATRNRAKKARLLLQKIALSWFQAIEAPGGSDVKEVSRWQRGMVDGLFEWPVWTQEGRMEELNKRKGPPLALEVPEANAAVQQQDEKAEEKPGNSKGNKKKGAPQKAGEEDLDSLFAEFGVSVSDKKSKKKSKK